MGPHGHRPESHRPDRPAGTRACDSSRHCSFSKIVPNCRKLGLLDAADGWLRTKFTELGVIQFESWTDTAEETDAQADGPPMERLAS